MQCREREALIERYPDTDVVVNDVYAEGNAPTLKSERELDGRSSPSIRPMQDPRKSRGSSKKRLHKERTVSG